MFQMLIVMIVQQSSIYVRIVNLAMELKMVNVLGVLRLLVSNTMRKLVPTVTVYVKLVL